MWDVLITVVLLFQACSKAGKIFEYIHKILLLMYSIFLYQLPIPQMITYLFRTSVLSGGKNR